MTKNSAVAEIDRRALISGIAAASTLSGALPMAAQAQTQAQTQTTAAGDGFSFAACGDSRPMMYLPFPFGRQSRGMGRSEDRGHSCRRAVSEKSRRDARATDLQIRFQGCAVRFLVDTAASTKPVADAADGLEQRALEAFINLLP